MTCRKSSVSASAMKKDEQEAPLGAEQLVADRGDEHDDRDQHDLYRRVQREAEPRAVLQNLAEEDDGRARPLVALARQTPEPHVAQLTERRVHGREEGQHQQQRAGAPDFQLGLHKSREQ